MRRGASTERSTEAWSFRQRVVQERLGHSSIVMTMDTYGHLFPSADDGQELAQAELRPIG